MTEPELCKNCRIRDCFPDACKTCLVKIKMEAKAYESTVPCCC